MLVDSWFGSDSALVASFSSALGYVLVVALFAIFSEGQRYLDVSTGVAAGRRLQTDEEVSAEQAHHERCQRLIEEAGLTARERDILTDVLRDKGLLSIAHALGISENTVKTHVQNIYRKFDVHGRQELMKLFAVADGELAVQPVGIATPDAQVVPAKKAALNQAIDTIAATHGLTRREREVFSLLARGYRYGEIQEKLSLSSSTVHTHVTNIYAKVDLHSHADLSKLVHKTRDALAHEETPA